MENFADLFKQITASNRLMLSILVTATAVTIGPNYFAWIKPVPKNWEWIPITLAIFSLVMLAISIITALWAKAKSLPKIIGAKVLTPNPTEFEMQLLKEIAHTRGEDALNLDLLDYRKIDRLNILSARDRLSEMGLTRHDPYIKNLIWITKAGREHLLKNRK